VLVVSQWASIGAIPPPTTKRKRVMILVLRFFFGDMWDKEKK
jgi:hypothetical protein